MTLRVLIVDDETLARTRLRTLLGCCHHHDVQIVGEAANAPQAMALVQHQQPDVVLLDIQMPGVDGIQLAQAFRSLPHPPLLIFVTAHAEYAVSAFELEAVDYLTKPVRLERLQSALDKAQRMAGLLGLSATETSPECLLMSELGKVVRLPLARVIYLKAELKYITVRTADASYVHDSSLSQIEERYPGRFLRIHRNALVAPHAIKALIRHKGNGDSEDGEGWAVQLAEVDETLPVSRRQVAAIREALGA